MTTAEVKTQLQHLFSVMFPAKPDHVIHWDALSYKPMVDETFEKCKPHFGFTADELYGLATAWLSDRDLTDDDLSRLKSMCAAW